MESQATPWGKKLDPILGGRTYLWFCAWFSVHGIGCLGMYIYMYCNIERNIMKNQAGSPNFGIQGKISMYMCFMCYVLALFIFCVLEFVCK